MPDPRNSYGGGGVAPVRPQKQSPLPPRPVSTAPYPDDDVAHMPGSYNSYGSQNLRPSSSGPQADRPSSAFGIRPLVPTSASSMGQGMRPSQDSMRPSSSMGNMSLPAGRGSNPQRIVSSGWEPQVPPKYRDQSPVRPPSLPVIDMGRPTNFDQPSSGRLQKPPPPNINKPIPPQPSKPNQGYDSNSYGQQPYNSAIPRRDPAANQFTRPERGSSMTPVTSPPIMSPPSQQRPDRYDSTQPQNPSRASQRPPQHTMSSQGQNARPASVAPSVASSQSGPPKKQGPSTFEEMGIPTAKNDSDCVIPTTLISHWPVANCDLDTNVIYILVWWMCACNWGLDTKLEGALLAFVNFATRL